jgi:hypothetical protein
MRPLKGRSERLAAIDDRGAAGIAQRVVHNLTSTPPPNKALQLTAPSLGAIDPW